MRKLRPGEFGEVQVDSGPSLCVGHSAAQRLQVSNEVQRAGLEGGDLDLNVPGTQEGREEEALPGVHW
jgi:hypothetical protein